MKKKLCAMLALLLCAALLCGCSGRRTEDVVPAMVTDAPETPEPTPEPTPKPYVPPTDAREGQLDVIPFDEMPYERPDLDELRTAIDAVGQALDRHAGYDEVEGLLDECDRFYNSFYTMYSISFIRSCQDTTDEYYADEYAWCDEASADMSQLMEDLYFRCGMSHMAKELEEKYFWPGFAEEYADDSNAFYDDEMVELLQQESNLVAEYRELVANPIIILEDGSELELITAMEELSGYAYLDAITRYYDQYNPKLARVYIDMVKNRQLQARHAGYDSYEELAFDHGFQRDYSPELAAEYLENIKTYIVPLYQEVSIAHPSWALDEGELSAQRLEDILRYGVQDMGDEVLDTYEFMVKYRLCDISYNPRKAEMSFQTYLGSYEVPFLFMDAGGNLGDITTFSHEFGHYLDGYLNYDADETIDLAECYSQAMELLMLTRVDDVLSPEEAGTLYELKMQDILSMYVQQAAFAEFEHIIYGTAPEDLTPEYVNAVFLELSQEYGFCEAGFESLYAMLWMDISHFYEQPFYVITYPVSHDIAMQIFQLERETPGAGLEKYLAILPREYENMLDTALNGGLESPFDPGRLEKVADTLREILLPDEVENAA